jgi:hypothetical protein
MTGEDLAKALMLLEGAERKQISFDRFVDREGNEGILLKFTGRIEPSTIVRLKEIWAEAQEKQG